MFSVKNRSNIRQVTPFADFGPFEAKTFYPISKIYANALAFFEQKPQFEVFKESLPVVKKEEQKPAVPPKPTEVVAPVVTEEKPKLEEEVVAPVVPTEAPAPTEAPVAEKKPKARRSL